MTPTRLAERVFSIESLKIDTGEAEAAKDGGSIRGEVTQGNKGEVHPRYHQAVDSIGDTAQVC